MIAYQTIGLRELVDWSSLRTAKFHIALFPCCSRVSGVTPDSVVVIAGRVSAFVASGWSTSFGKVVSLRFVVALVILVGIPTLTCLTRSCYVQRSGIEVPSLCVFTIHSCVYMKKLHMYTVVLPSNEVRGHNMNFSFPPLPGICLVSRLF